MSGDSPLPPGLALPRVIGHRGAAALAPENTLAGVDAAAALGARMVEVDVKLTADGVPILMHDDDLDRTTDGRGAVRATPLAVIRRLDAGRWFGPAFAGERVPTLAEALVMARQLDLALNLEIKPCAGRERETALVALAEARRLWPADRPPPLVSSFELESLLAAREAAPDWPRGYLIWERPADWSAIADAVGAATIAVNHAFETPDGIAACRATGRPVLAYTVNDPARARALFALGVAAVFSDRPDLSTTGAPSRSRMSAV